MLTFNHETTRVREWEGKVKEDRMYVFFDIGIVVALMCRKHLAMGTWQPVCKCELQVQ